MPLNGAGKIDRNLLRETLARGGFGSKLPGVEKTLLELDKEEMAQRETGFKVEKAKNEFIAQAKRDTSQNPSDANLTAFKEDLIAGIKMYITDLVNFEKTNMPMRTFTEKPNAIYVYSKNVDLTNNNEKDNELQKPVWKTMENALFERLITRISHRFLQEYSNFQQELF